MTNTVDIQSALANEARRGELRQRIASLKGGADATASLVSLLTTMNGDSALQLASAQAELSALEAGAGPGITDDFGPKSSVTVVLEGERLAAKAAVIDFVKANPTCALDAAAAVWHDAALASHASLAYVLQDGLAMEALYRSNLLVMEAITDDTWEAHRDWIVATPKDKILAY